MGKNKLAKFADMESFSNVLQCPYSQIAAGNLSDFKGKWHERFGNGNPIVLELGCGRGEYAVGLAERYADKNFIGVDIKGARMWHGAKEALQKGIGNVLFLRTEIEYINQFFDAAEVDEIWITFPDPQMKKVRKRLTSTRFMQLYLDILKPAGIIHLKTDSPFLFTYTKLMAEQNAFPVLDCKTDVHASENGDGILSIKTNYETQWIERGMAIKYLAFVPERRNEFVEPTEEIPFDDYRSYNRRSNRTITK